VLVVKGELGTNTSLAPMIVKTALTDLQHVMSCFIDDHDIQNILVYTLMPILCKHANTNGTTGMHAIVVFVLECMRVHLHIYNTFTTIEEQTSTLANGFVLLWKMITDRSEYVGIIGCITVVNCWNLCKKFMHNFGTHRGVCRKQFQM